MSDFTGNVGDGDLQAIVRGYNNNPSTSFVPFTTQLDDEFDFSTFPDTLFETTMVLDELEELYKPFYPLLNNIPLSPQTSLSQSGGQREPAEKAQEKEPFKGSSPVVKYKRRKNQEKRVVHQVTGEGVVSVDVWCWRKYGQKPIKGSPYPRSYYRCSSSKVCLARKQVERSLSDRETFVITYTADHCHGQPTRRNSLAGISRPKFPTPKTSTVGVSDHCDTPTSNGSCSSPISLETNEYELWQQ